MINLIGPSRRKQFLAARRNSIWIRYVFILSSTSLAIILILGGSAFFFYGQKVDQDAKLAANEQKLQAEKYQSAEKKVADFRKNLSTAKTVLDAETYYSFILLEVAKTMPENTRLVTFTLNAATFQGQQTLDFEAKKIEDALALKSAFIENPPLSSKVRFSEITKSSGNANSSSSADSSYPVLITMIMELAKPEGSTGTIQSKTNPAGSN
ncbi:hypothetical protein A3F64_02720 [Candidatus Saccharibacteria bacterium RIFCSPHIGHO2_12_FULL_42_8]|nr:MAG: hypothetical protein A3F64_02720 [Candidatus Saccharibacteria bacterium RIFCSPHIGHO2_12_FULL_42_8]